MKNITLLVKDLLGNVTVESVAFDADEAVEKVGENPLNFENGETEYKEGIFLGRLAIMTIDTAQYKELLEREEMKSLYEISSQFEATDGNDDSYFFPISKILNRLPDCEDKTEVIEKLGLKNDCNESMDAFDLDAMIVN